MDSAISSEVGQKPKDTPHAWEAIKVTTTASIGKLRLGPLPGELVSAARAGAGVSVEALAARLGVSAACIRDVEAGRLTVHAGWLAAAMRAVVTDS